MSKPVIRKHSAKVLSITDQTGEVFHYVLVGGKWYYNGRSGFNLSINAKDGFFLDSIKEILGEHRYGNSLNQIKSAHEGFTKVRSYIREWESAQYAKLVNGVPF